MTQPPPYGGQPPYGAQDPHGTQPAGGQPYGAQPYVAQPPPYGAYPPSTPTNVMAIISLVCAFVFAPAGLVCGIIARRQIKQSREQGDGLALAGIIISIVQLVIGVIALGFLLFTFLAIGTAISHFPTPSPTPFG